MVGLLAVAVVIALIGVTNTLSLSVIERTRESATLRAIGLWKEQLRGMLAVEGMLIAGVGAMLGILLGLLFGWAGATTALSIMGEVRSPSRGRTSGWCSPSPSSPASSRRSCRPGPRPAPHRWRRSGWSDPTPPS